MTAPRWPRLHARHSLLSQVLAINALLVTATVLVASIAARLDLQIGVERRAFLVLLLAILVTLLANAFLLRRRFAPLERLIDTMERVDLSGPGVRAEVETADSTDVIRLHQAFNRMLARLEAVQGELAGTLDAQRRFMADASHELRTPLTSLRGNLDILARNPGMPSAERGAALAEDRGWPAIAAAHADLYARVLGR
jgi:signal transduction histidine kinase